MEFLKYFFRSTPDYVYFKNYSIAHLILVAIAILGVVLIFKYNYKIKKNERVYNFFRYGFIFLIVLHQGLLYGWYIFSGAFTIQVSLPLYNCRIALIFTVIALITNKQFFRIVGCYWGILGAIIALSMVNSDPYSFPHYTIVSYFLGHIVLLWANMFIVAVEGFRFDNRNFKKMLIFTNLYNIFIYLFDIGFKANYCYLVKSPFFTEQIFDVVGKAGYTIAIYVLFNVIIVGVYAIASSKLVNGYLERKQIA